MKDKKRKQDSENIQYYSDRHIIIHLFKPSVLYTTKRNLQYKGWSLAEDDMSMGFHSWQQYLPF